MEERQVHKPWGTILLAFLIIALIILISTGRLEEWIGLLPFKDARFYIYPLLILFFTVIIAKMVAIVLQKYFEQARGHLRIVDRTRFALFTKLTTLLIYIIGVGIALSVIPAMRNLSTSLFASAGVLAIIIGFATQKTLGNLVSGTMIAIYQPYRIGDKIRFGEEYGTIEDITLRHTVINTWDNRRVIIPNSKMDEEVINNFTIKDPKILGWLDIGISYDSDIDLARAIMKDEALQHPDFIDNRNEADLLAAEDPVKVRVVETGDFAVKMRLYYWAADQPTNFRIKCDLTESIKKRFDKEGIEIPFPYRTIVQKKDLPKPKRARKR